MTAPAPDRGKLIFSPSPHISSGEKTSCAMYTFIIALLPAAAFSISMYGMHSLRVMAVAVCAAMAFEWLTQKLFRVEVTLHDGSALLTGLLLAMVLPPSVPWWLVVVGAGLSIIVGKQLFGGLGGNPFCPAVVGWAILRLSWNNHINFDLTMLDYDLAFSIDYPLSVLKSTGTAGLESFTIANLALGKQVGGLGATSAVAILAGGVILIARGVISWRIPVFFLIGVAATAWVFWTKDSTLYADPMFHLVTGNVMLGAFFLSTDYPSSPVGGLAMALFGLGCGIFTVLFRAWSTYPDGVMFAILFMNILTPLLDKLRPKVPARA